MKRYYLTVIFLIMSIFAAFGAPGDPYSAIWKKVDSLMSTGLPQSAEKLVVEVYQEAQSKGQHQFMVKAQLYLIELSKSFRENAMDSILSMAKQEAESSEFPFNAIWSSIAAQMYWEYYQSNRWTVLSRSNVADQDAGDDFHFWDAGRFYKEVSYWFKRSIMEPDRLQSYPVDSVSALLQKGKDGQHLRPSLYDLLAFRAISFYENEEKDVTRPAYRFYLDDEAVFYPASEFAQHVFTTDDTTSLHYQALVLFQELIRFHLQDSDPGPLVDADLYRLKFAHQHSVMPDKKERYLQALNTIADKYQEHPVGAIAAFEAASLQVGSEFRPATDLSNSKLPTIAEQLRNIIQKHPNTEAAKSALELIQYLERKEISLIAEEVVIPNEYSKLLITYRNTPRVYFKLIALEHDTIGRLLTSGHVDSVVIRKLRSLQPIASWIRDLPAVEDMNLHRVEMEVQPLPQGSYVLVAGSEEDLFDGAEVLEMVQFQVSELSVVSVGDIQEGARRVFILNRRTGAPVGGALVNLYNHYYDRESRSYRYKAVGKATTEKDGSFKINQERVVRLVVSHKDQLLFQDGYFDKPGAVAESSSSRKSFFFTDRAIYRPGQTIYFKGIILEEDGNGRKHKVLSNFTTAVGFYDANGDLVAEQKLETNEYGSVSGSFIAPEGGLTGSMMISDGHGESFFSVEAYKRPHFKPIIEDSLQEFSLGDTVALKLSARTFSDVPVDGATVRFRVERRTYFPYRWLFFGRSMPTEGATEIAHGTAVTDESGKALINFVAFPDPKADAATNPIFIYTVSADVVDINGETRSVSYILQLGYRSLQIIASVPEEVTAGDLDSIQVLTSNLNGSFIPADFRLRIFRLQPPPVYYRSRLWQEPDQFLLTEPEFRKLFPNDVYRNEDQVANWKVTTDPVYDRRHQSDESGKIPIPKATWNKGGWYLIEVEALDSKGREVIEKRYVRILDPGKGNSRPYGATMVSSKSSFQPGEKARVWLISDIGDMYWIQGSSSQNFKGLQLTNLEKGQSLEWTEIVSEEDRGGIYLFGLAVYQNRVYELRHNIAVPWRNKELDIIWEAHRDKLEPGANETWSMTIRGKDGEPVAAELVATLYDASLDMFLKHDWNKPNLYSSNYNFLQPDKYGFGSRGGRVLRVVNRHLPMLRQKEYDQLIFMEMGSFINYGYRYKTLSSYSTADPSLTTRDDMSENHGARQDEQNLEYVIVEEEVDAESVELRDDPIVAMRTNLSETAFFFSELRTDEKGNLRIDFTIPEALTEWRLMAMAHSKDLRFGSLEGSIVTQKDLMVTPGLPRFFRQGDKILVTAKINNNTAQHLSGNARLELEDGLTGKALSLPFRLTEIIKKFEVGGGAGTVVVWELTVPQAQYNPVVVRVIAQTDKFTDGETHLVPVVSNRVMVTETKPLWINGFGTKQFNMDKLLRSAEVPGLAHHRLTIEYTSNPSWYVVQSLPYLSEYPYDCAEQIFNRFYANMLAAHIVQKIPNIEKVFEAWLKDTSALMSQLEKNQELKTALLEETPWVLDANNEREQKQKIARLFNTAQLRKGSQQALNKLESMLLPEGAFPWFSGNTRPDRFITQYIATGLGRMQRLGIDHSAGKEMAAQLLPWLDDQIVEDYKSLDRRPADKSQQQIGPLQVHYLYMRSFFKTAKSDAASKAIQYYKEQSAKYWMEFNPYMKGMIALSLWRQGDRVTPQVILRSLRETAVQHEELGIYWPKSKQSWWWYEAPIEMQSLLIEAFWEIASDTAYVDGMRLWLLKQKETQRWGSTKATADACYSFLLQGTDWLGYEPSVSIQLGESKLVNAEQGEAGTGYFKTSWGREEMTADMGQIKLSVTPASGGDKSDRAGASYGAVYWQYFSDIDKITASGSGLEVRKQLFVVRNTDRGEVLELVTEGSRLRVGDRLVSRIEIVSDRDMEYVHLKDMRGSGFEPLNVLSGYRWRGGLGYYESTSDVSTNFFIDYLPKGKFVVEYSMHVSHKGIFSAGIASLQCMYAPAYTANSAGIKVEVTD